MKRIDRANSTTCGNGNPISPPREGVGEAAVRIVDIARLAGVSVGTVDRVLHKRGKVSEENRRKIQAVLDEVGYRPNLVARSLALKKQFNVVAILPAFTPGQYWEAIAGGIDRAAAEVKQYNIRVTKLFFDQYDKDSFDRTVSEFENLEADGVLIATLFNDSVVALSHRLNARKVPYVYVDSNIEGERQLAYFGTDSYDGGRIAARLLTEHVDSKSDILIARIIHKGKNDSHQGVNRRNGFCESLRDMHFAGTVREVELRPDDERYNESMLDEAFRRFPAIEGAVMFNSTCYMVGEYLKRKHLRHVRLVGYDLIDNNTKLLTEGIVTALIAQRPEAQGYGAVKSLADYLILNQTPPVINLMPIDILIKENIKYYRP